MKSVSWRSCVVAVGILLSIAPVGGCEVTSQKIQQWKGTQKGPAKLRAAVLDTKLKPALRVEAAEALAEINLVDYLAKDLKTLAGKDRSVVADRLAQRLIARMRGTSEQATTKVQIQAKDALFSLRLAFEAQRIAVDTALVEWLAGDWLARSGGEHSADKIVTTLGKRAAPALARRVGVDVKVVITLAELVRKIGTQKDRDVAGAKLVALASEQAPPQKRTFEALGKIGAAKARAFLQSLAGGGKVVKYRAWAFRALTFDPNAGTVTTALAVAENTKAAKELRAAAFEAVEKIPGEKTATGLAKIIATDAESLVRYRAIEAIIACCGVQGVQKLLAALPSRSDYKQNDVRDFIEKDIKPLGKKALPALRSGLASKSWIARVIAVRLIGQLGSKQDIPALKKRVGDRARLKGWGKPATVASEAKAAIARLDK